MLNWAFTAAVTAAVVLAGYWELRRAWRETGTRFHTFIHAERPAEDCADSLDDAATAGVMTPDALEALIWATRENPPLSMTWCDPGDVDRIDDLVHEWAKQQREGR